MKKIIEIFKNDLKNLTKSKMAIMIIIGIIIIPGIYAWLNIDSNWGPYDNTGNLPLAIVNNDKGVNILGQDVNVGNKIEESLKKNKAMKWIFTNEKNAKRKTKQGKYYGAIIIPKDFSKNITTIMENGEVIKPKITKDAKNYQIFFGRFMLFASIALTQGLMIGLGDLFLGIQTINTPLFLLTLMVSSITFMLIIYSLTSTFGKIGQALSIVIMVLQVAGSGGTFPVKLLPRGFQIMQPYMPFYPAMSAARETIGGFYGNDYIKYMFLLICHMIILPLIIDLVINKLTYKTKEKLKKELHSTEVIE